MQTRRWAVVGLAAAASLAFATAACGTKSDNPVENDSPISTTPKDALLASAKDIKTSSFTFEMKDAESTGTGVVDVPAKSATMTMKVTGESPFTMDFLVIDSDTYVKMDFGALPIPNLPPKDKWMHLDRTKIKDVEALDLDIAKDPDPAGVEIIFRAISTAEKSGDRQYKGTVDLTKATDSGIVDEDVVKALGDAAKAVPFEAALDDKGRITSLKLNIPAAGTAKAQVWQVTFASYGSAPKVEKPPANLIIEAPASIYDIFNG